MKLTCGVDWAEAHYDVALVDGDGVVVARARIDTGATGFNKLLALIAEHEGSAQDTPVSIETDKNLLVVALVEAGFTVYPINPRAVARYRERYGQAGGKSDPGDAAVLAHILRTDRHLHRQMPAVSEQGRAVKALARQHQEAIWALHQTVSRLRSVLLEFYPQALQAFPNLTHKAALTVLAAAPTPASSRQLTRRRVVTLLQRSAAVTTPPWLSRSSPTCTPPPFGSRRRSNRPLATPWSGSSGLSSRCSAPSTISNSNWPASSTSTRRRRSCAQHQGWAQSSPRAFWRDR
jgi:Transposase